MDILSVCGLFVKLADTDSFSLPHFPPILLEFKEIDDKIPPWHNKERLAFSRRGFIWFYVVAPKRTAEGLLMWVKTEYLSTAANNEI